MIDWANCKQGKRGEQKYIFARVTEQRAIPGCLNCLGGYLLVRDLLSVLYIEQLSQMAVLVLICSGDFHRGQVQS